MLQRTPLFDAHLRAGARMVDFAGWEMPLHYGSQLEEHRRVREDCGMFDVSHMRAVDVSGEDGTRFLRYLLANDVARLDAPGRALYSCMLDESGGILDDLLVYRLQGERYRLIVNAATAEADIAWLQRQAAAYDAAVTPRDYALIAVQGPRAREVVLSMLEGDARGSAERLARFAAVEFGEFFVARTGYTGEDGFELMLPQAGAEPLWTRLREAGVAPCGLGARDTLRLEAGLNLYGQDMNRDTTPLEANLGWTVAWEPAERDFVGRAALERQREGGAPRRLIGVVLDAKGVLRPHQTVLVDGRPCGELTSGSFAPTLGQAIGFARVESGAEGEFEVDIRGRRLPLRVVKPPFVRQGRPNI